MTKRHVRRGFLALGIVLACMPLRCPSAFALDPSLDVSQYAHKAWKIREGFTKGIIYAVAQTPDGYLWLGTEFGVLRFDGVRLVPLQLPADQPLPSNKILSLLAARDGTLWIGTEKGLAGWKDSKLTQYAELAGQFVVTIIEDREGSVWASGRAVAAGRLCAIHSGSVQCRGQDGSLGQGTLGLFEDRKGNLWAAVANGLWRWKPGSPKFYPLPTEPNGVQALAEDDDGTLLIGGRRGIQRFVEGKTEAYQLPGTLRQFSAIRLLRDRDGGLWIGTVNSGLLHVHQGRTDVFAQSDSLSGDSIGTLFEDREGSLWVTTTTGLDRFREFSIATYSVNQGISNALVLSVLAASDGSVWLGTSNGLNRWNNAQISIPRTGSGKPDGKLNGLAPNSLFQDGRGRIWISTLHEFGYLENDRFISVDGVPGGYAISIAEDARGGLWIANQDLGLFQLQRGTEVQRLPWASLGHQDFATALCADPLQGGLWLGFFQGGVAYFRDGQVRASYTPTDGLAAGRVNHLRLDQDGALWVATDGGLSRLKNHRSATLTSKNGLPCDSVQWTMEDDADSFWLGTACGLLRIAHPEIAAWTAAGDNDKDAKQTIRVTVFDNSDGVTSHASNTGYSPLVAKSAEGKLWFLPFDGVSVLDPRHLPFNSLPPPVHIEQITVDRKTYDTTSDSKALRLPPLSRDLQIEYTALSLVAPEKIRFRYKLEGYDQDWQEAGSRRQAFYSNLSPRNYRFRVIACNNSGVWNETGTLLDFTIAPAYYQTIWFRVLVVIAALLGLFALYRMRVRQVAQQVRAGMEGRLDERERIARDLHDTLLQSVQGLILKVHAVSKQITSDRAARQALEKTLDHADQVLAEGRDRVRNLRATVVSIDDLPDAFKRIAEETPQEYKSTFRTVVEGKVRELHPLVREESYCIGREAIINALIHSGGRHVEVEITYEPRQFRLRVRDDGHGINSKILEEGGRPDHWGMQGMRERASKIGAELKIWSGNETGTEVELTVPGTTAYQADGAKATRVWTALFRKLIK